MRGDKQNASVQESAAAAATKYVDRIAVVDGRKN